MSLLLQESPIKYRSSSLSFNNNNGGSALKLLNSTSSSFGVNKITQQPNTTGSRFFSRRSSCSLTRNTQGKLQNLKDELTLLNGEILDTRKTTKEAALYLKFMREDLNDRRLPEIESDLKQQVQMLKKQIGIVTRSDKLRFDGIWATVAQSQKNTRAISNRLFQLRNYVTRLENALGYYSGAEKHKY